MSDSQWGKRPPPYGVTETDKAMAPTKTNAYKGIKRQSKTSYTKYRPLHFAFYEIHI